MDKLIIKILIACLKDYAQTFNSTMWEIAQRDINEIDSEFLKKYGVNND